MHLRITKQRPLRQSIRLTSEGGCFFLLVVAVGMVAVHTGNNLFYLLLSMMVSVLVVSALAAEVSLRRLEVVRHLPDLLCANNPSPAALVIKNQKRWWPCYALQVSDVTAERNECGRGLVLLHLPPGASRILNYALTPSRRGLLKLSEVKISTAFPFGFFNKTIYYPSPAAVPVSPPVKPLPPWLMREVLETGLQRRIHRRGYGSELYNLRLYQPGDDSRTIHWLTTARTSQLIVRETEKEGECRATIYLSLLAPDSHDALFEDAVALAASLVRHLTSRGYWLRLVAGAVCSPFGHGDAHQVELLRILALCERQTPDTEKMPPAAAPLWLPESEPGGAIIIVRAWGQTPIADMRDFVAVIDIET
ncbi:MAG: DUF58 domain-containing protein [Nitrospira sp.]|nr:DUF58 domain-containing protein [Nitrospira sp.]